MEKVERNIYYNALLYLYFHKVPNGDILQNKVLP